MRKYKCRVCGNISSAPSYMLALHAHRDHFNETHGPLGLIHGFDRLPERVN